MVTAIVAVLAAICAFRWLTNTAIIIAMFIYMDQQGVRIPDAEDLTPHLKEAWLRILHLKNVR